MIEEDKEISIRFSCINEAIKANSEDIVAKAKEIYAWVTENIKDEE